MTDESGRYTRKGYYDRGQAFIDGFFRFKPKGDKK